MASAGIEPTEISHKAAHTTRRLALTVGAVDTTLTERANRLLMEIDFTARSVSRSQASRGSTSIIEPQKVGI